MDPHAPTPTSSSAAPLLAVVTEARGRATITLPPELATQAILQLFAMLHAQGFVLAPSQLVALAPDAPPNTWGLAATPGVGIPLPFIGPSSRLGSNIVFMFPCNTVIVSARFAHHVLRALELVKPERLDAAGRPAPWVPTPQAPHPARQAPQNSSHSDDNARQPLAPDDVIILTSPPIAPPTPPSPSLLAPELEPWLTALSRTAGLPRPELRITPRATDRLGFCAGRVTLSPDFQPLLIELFPCPNADLAELLATLLHELAHPLARTRAHDDAFKRALIDLATRHFGAPALAPASAHLTRPARVLDMWVTSCLRSIIRNSEPPSLRPTDDGQLAKALARVRRLRDLAHDQLGKPEAIVATALANDLIVTHGLEHYQLDLDPDLHDGLVDRFIVLPDAAVWRRTLAQSVATFCDVFSLATPAKRRLHFFGRHADVVAAEYLAAVSTARIERACQAHLATWKRSRSGGGAQTLRERTSFCDSAAAAFRRKLERAKAEDPTTAAPPPAPTPSGVPPAARLARAEAFAADEHRKRGLGWAAGRRRTYTANHAGAALGEAMEIVRGLESPATPEVLRLPRR